MSKWKPGQIVTVDGVVYRVKRNDDSKSACKKCALARGPLCMWNDSKEYRLLGYDYLVRLSPVTVMK